MLSNRSTGAHTASIGDTRIVEEALKFTLFTESAVTRGSSYQRRYLDLVEEAVFAEEMGFDTWGTSEHHFIGEMACTPSPEVIFTAVAMRTNTMRLRHMGRLASAVHPVLIAEQTMSEDIFSNGRVEVAFVRGNTLLQLDAFGVPLDDSKARADEGMELFVRAVSDDVFEHDGKHWGTFPPRQLTPKGVQEPHPPLFKIAQTGSSIYEARVLGMGCLTSDMWLGWDEAERLLACYNSVKDDELKPIVRRTTKAVGLIANTVRCAKTNDRAMEIGERDMIMMSNIVLKDLYQHLAQRSDMYREFKMYGEILDKIEDPEWLRDCGPSVMVGDPAHLIQMIERLESLGADEVVMRIDNGPHNELMETIETIGRYVIPHFKNPKGVLSSGAVGVLPGDAHQKTSIDDYSEANRVL
ncbi:alkanesulfonate monooxygenase SsuD/methylene tetrahydromethanopterin reductase-like flavin-dependent oxidoreductase (luciferase family) [Mycolicibacterium sp. 624]